MADIITNIVLRRGGGFRDMFRAYQIIVDGREVGKIKRNSEVCIPVQAGMHTVQLKIDWCISPKRVVSVVAGLSMVFECGPNHSSSAFSNTDYYIWLDATDRGQTETSSRSSREEKDEKGFENQKSGSYRGSESTDSRRNEDRASSSRPTLTAWHDILQIPPDSSMVDIRSAYRRRMSEYHPDKVAQLGEEIRQVAERKSKEINAAYNEVSRQFQDR